MRPSSSAKNADPRIHNVATTVHPLINPRLKAQSHHRRRHAQCGAQKIGHYHQRRLPMELILIIVVLLLLFGGGGGYFGRSRGYW
jgi:hypothetical protein